MTSVTGTTCPAANHNEISSSPARVEELSEGGAVSAAPDAAPPAAETPLERSLARLKAADNAFRHCDGKLRLFMNQHSAFVNGRTVFIGSDVTDGERLGREYGRLYRELDLAQRKFQVALQEYARAKCGHGFEPGVQER